MGGATASGLVSPVNFVEEIDMNTKIANTITASQSPEPRYGHSVVSRQTTDGATELIIFGGLTTKGNKKVGLNDVHSLNLRTSKWTQLFLDNGTSNSFLFFAKCFCTTHISVKYIKLLTSFFLCCEAAEVVFGYGITRWGTKDKVSSLGSSTRRSHGHLGWKKSVRNVSKSFLA